MSGGSLGSGIVPSGVSSVVSSSVGVKSCAEKRNGSGSGGSEWSVSGSGSLNNRC